MARIIDTDNKNLIGNKVKLLRKKKHMSQQQLSDKLETLAIYICRGSISRIFCVFALILCKALSTVFGLLSKSLAIVR